MTRVTRSSLLRACVLSAVLPCAVIQGGAAEAIIIRHDVDDAAYLARESEFPALFGIYRNKAGHKRCVATLIAPRWALTAAHCTGDEALLAAAKPGGAGYRVEVAGQVRRIDRVILHPGKAGERAPDVALLRLASPVTDVAPIPLYRGRDELGRIVLMPGWGTTGTGKSGVGPVDGLFRAAENIVDRVEEQKLWWRFDAPGAGSRALALEGISGPGDSGGPALIRSGGGWSIAGISSGQDTMGGPEGMYGVEEVFVRVSSVARWIDGVTGGIRSQVKPRSTAKRAR